MFLLILLTFISLNPLLLQDAVALLEPMTQDSAPIVRQGALVALALVMMQQPNGHPKVCLCQFALVCACESREYLCACVQLHSSLCLFIMKSVVHFLQRYVNHMDALARRIVSSPFFLPPPSPQTDSTRRLFQKVASDKHEDLLAKFGAIFSQGIMEAGESSERERSLQEI